MMHVLLTYIFIFRFATIILNSVGTQHREPALSVCGKERGDLLYFAGRHRKWGCGSVGRASDRHAADAGSIPRCGQRFFSPRVNFQCRLSYGVRTPPCAIACINICAHVNDPVVHIRVRWIMETLKHPACTVGKVARFCCSWLSSGKTQPEFPIGEIPLGQYRCKK